MKRLLLSVAVLGAGLVLTSPAHAQKGYFSVGPGGVNYSTGNWSAGLGSGGAYYGPGYNSNRWGPGGYYGSGYYGSGYYGSGLYGSGYGYNNPYMYNRGYGSGYYPGSYSSGYQYSSPSYAGNYYYPKGGYYSSGTSPGYYSTPGAIQGSYNYSSAYGPAQGTQSGAMPAHFQVTLPDPNAEVWVNGNKTYSRGPSRTYTTPMLQPGQTYTYNLRAAWFQNGKWETQDRQIQVTPGETTQVSFTDGDMEPIPEGTPAPKQKLNDPVKKPNTPVPPQNPDPADPNPGVELDPANPAVNPTKIPTPATPKKPGGQ